MRATPRLLFTKIGQWEERILSCQSDEELARLVKVRFQTLGSKRIDDTALFKRREDQLMATYVAAKRANRDIGASSFSSFLAAANTAKSNRKAVSFFIGELRASSVTPDVHLLRTMCHCLALDGDLADAEEAFVRLTGSHMLFDYEMLIRTYARHRLPRRAAAVFKKAIRLFVPTSTSVFNAAIEKQPDYARCVPVLREMQRFGIAPDEKTMTTLLRVCRYSREVARAEKVAEVARAHGLLTPHVRHSLLIVFLHAGAWEKYDGYLSTLEMTPTIAATQLQACAQRKDWAAAEAVFFPEARLRNASRTLWLLMLGVYKAARQPEKAVDLCKAHLARATPPSTRASKSSPAFLSGRCSRTPVVWLTPKKALGLLAGILVAGGELCVMQRQLSADVSVDLLAVLLPVGGKEEAAR
ncbi:hypothetical protein DIPPA_01520 [Diplonema papillatum]|nr:hypothetical protein DIPPA_01520 [Diplonema papillatum]